MRPLPIRRLSPYQAKMGILTGLHPRSSRVGMVNRDAARLMAEIPRDTRDLTARLMGDPLPSRSALSTQEGKGT